MNLVARFGREKGVWLFVLSLCAAYGAILAGVILKRIPFLGLVSLLTLPIAWKTVSILRTHYREPLKMVPANLGMICIHNFTAILLILVYFIEGFRSENLIATFLPFIVLIILYTPIARLVGKALFSQKLNCHLCSSGL